MDKIKNILLAIGGLILAFFYALLKSKDRQIEKHKDEADKQRAEAEMQSNIAESAQKAKHVRDHLNSSTEPDIDRMLDDKKAYRD